LNFLRLAVVVLMLFLVGAGVVSPYYAA